MSKIDLHSHSLYSLDGQYEPKDLLKMAQAASLKLFAITDHNSVKAPREVLPFIQNYSFDFLSGIEIDCTFQNTNFHLLGYNINPDDKAWDLIEDNYLSLLKDNQEKQIKAIESLGIVVNRGKLYSKFPNKLVVPEDIASVVIEDSANDDNEIIADYRPTGKRGDSPLINFYWDLCADGRPAQAPLVFPSAIEMLTLIHRQGGKAIVAHPGVNFDTNPQYVSQLLQAGVDGIEAYSSYHTPQQTNYWLQLAQKLNKEITIGSDYHGQTKPKITLGCVQVNNESQIEDRLLTYFNLSK